MRIAHIADTHFGKDLKRINFSGVDQEYWIEKFMESIKAEQVDTVIIAGDVYDDKVPPLQAIRRFNDFLNKLHQEKLTVLIVPGNHDQATRLAVNSSILKEQNIFVAEELQKDIMQVQLPVNPDGEEKINFWLLPYVTPLAANVALERNDISGYDQAVRELLAAQEMDKEQLNVLVAHQNVTSGATERILNENESSIGFSGEVDFTAFDGFDYVALGHIHGMQKIGRDTVRYAGAPLQYDFSEEGRWKGYLLIDIKAKHDITIIEKELKPLHQLVVYPKGAPAATLEELLELGHGLTADDKINNYFKVRIWRDSLSGTAKEQLDSVYGINLLDIEPVSKSKKSYDLSAGGGSTSRSLLENLEALYKNVYNEEVSDLEKLVAEKLLQQQEAEGYLNVESKSKDNEKLVNASVGELLGVLEKVVAGDEI